jgi:hypothetical protein
MEVAPKKELHCRTVMEVALMEEGPSYQAALVAFLEHIGHQGPQGMTAYFERHNL